MNLPSNLSLQRWDDADESDDTSFNSDRGELPLNMDIGKEDDETHKGDLPEEEDELIKAIRRENTNQQNHPPVIHCDNYVVDIAFHPLDNILGVADVAGEVTLYRYTNDENVNVSTSGLHTKPCCDIEFGTNGKLLFSTSEDKAITISDVESSELTRFYENSHDAAVYSLSVVSENLFATGDLNGTIKLWDLRLNHDSSIFTLKKNEGYISDICSHNSQKYLFCSSGDGSLTTIDLQNRKFLMQSEDYKEALTCLGLFRSETKLMAGSYKGNLFSYNWGEFGLHSDVFPRTKCPINDMVPVTENIVVSACDDGNLRAVHLFPNSRHLGIVGRHGLSIERVDISNDRTFIASSSDDYDIRFWNIQYFQDFENVSTKRNKLETGLNYF